MSSMRRFRSEFASSNRLICTYASIWPLTYPPWKAALIASSSGMVLGLSFGLTLSCSCAVVLQSAYLLLHQIAVLS